MKILLDLRRIWCPLLIAIGIALVQPSTAWAVDNDDKTSDQTRDPDELARMSLEELGSIIVTSVSKKPELLSDAPASIYVITQDDIRRSGATSLPDALRLAPNLQVAQISASGYAISARGFNSTSANKLLVLIDGRSVYSPLFSGVFWDVQDVMLEDIERIEVISGPGGTLWGVNAVNGVINVITRSAKDTQGGVAAAGGGNQEKDDFDLRYGGAFGADGNYRFYAKTFDQNHTSTADGSPVNDGWHQSQLGFRTDWTQAGDQFTTTGNAYRGTEAQPAPGEIDIAGMNILLGDVLTSGENLTSHWIHHFDAGSELSVQAYLDRTERVVNPTFTDTLNVADLQVQHSLQPTGMHVVNWGAEYRYGADNLINSQYVAFLPTKLNQTWASLFAQDEIALRDTLRLTVGARIEHNDYTGNEFLPNVRLAWKVNANEMLWSAVSRTVRAPSRLDRDIYVPGTAPFLLNGGSDVVSEVANVFEIGYRTQSSANFSYSATMFHAIYDHLRTAELASGGTSIVFSNGMEGSTSGIEMWGSYQVSAVWRLSAGLTGLKEKLQLYPGSSGQFVTIEQGNDPAQTWSLRSSFDISRQSEMDVIVRHVSALSNPVVPAYSATDLRYGWRPRKNLELSVTAKNLFGSGHGEFTDVSTRTEFGRAVFCKIVSQF